MEPCTNLFLWILLNFSKEVFLQNTSGWLLLHINNFASKIDFHKYRKLVFWCWGREETLNEVIIQHFWRSPDFWNQFLVLKQRHHFFLLLFIYLFIYFVSCDFIIFHLYFWQLVIIRATILQKVNISWIRISCWPS